MYLLNLISKKTKSAEKAKNSVLGFKMAKNPNFGQNFSLHFQARAIFKEVGAMPFRGLFTLTPPYLTAM